MVMVGRCGSILFLLRNPSFNSEIKFNGHAKRLSSIFPSGSKALRRAFHIIEGGDFRSG